MGDRGGGVLQGPYPARSGYHYSQTLLIPGSHLALHPCRYIVQCIKVETVEQLEMKYHRTCHNIGTHIDKVYLRKCEKMKCNN